MVGEQAGWYSIMSKRLYASASRLRRGGKADAVRRVRNYPDTRNYTNTVDAENQRKPALDRAVACIQTFANSFTPIFRYDFGYVSLPEPSFRIKEGEEPEYERDKKTDGFAGGAARSC